MIEILATVYIALAIVVVLYLYLRTGAKALAARREANRALSYLAKGEDGTLYVRDPQNPGTLHRLDDLLVKRALEGEAAVITTPRQKRKLRRHIRQAIGAR